MRWFVEGFILNQKDDIIHLSCCSLLPTHSASLIQSWNRYQRPALPSTTITILPGKAPKKLYPPPTLEPVLPPTHPRSNNLLVFSNKIVRPNTSPSSSISFVLITHLFVEDIWLNRGILKHSAASLARSRGEARLPAIPWGLLTLHSLRPNSAASFLILCMNAPTLTSLLSPSRSKQLKYCFCVCLMRQLPRLLAMARAMLLADVMRSALMASQRVMRQSSCWLSRSMVPPTLLSLGSTMISKDETTRKYSLTISQAVQKVSIFDRLATS